MKAVVVLLVLSVIVYNVRALPTSSEENDENDSNPAIFEAPKGFGFSRPLFCNFRCHIRCLFRGYWTGYCDGSSCKCAGNRNPNANNGNGNNNNNPTSALPDESDPTEEGIEGTSTISTTSSKLPGFPTLPPVAI